MSKVSVVIPALNEEEPIAGVVRECLATGVPFEVIVVDNGSTDGTAERARDAGARVVTAPRGYGRACSRKRVMCASEAASRQAAEKDRLAACVPRACATCALC